jgi:hypothetical protein
MSLAIGESLIKDRFSLLSFFTLFELNFSTLFDVLRSQQRIEFAANARMTSLAESNRNIALDRYARGCGVAAVAKLLRHGRHRSCHADGLDVRSHNLDRADTSAETNTVM